jgi:hypothetical protein
VLRTSQDATGCEVQQVRDAANTATIIGLGRAGGDEIVLAEVQAPCLCRNASCPYYVLRIGTRATRLLYSTFAFAAHIEPAAPLPDLVFAEHDTVAVIGERTAAYRGGVYADVSSARVRVDTGARKPDEVPVRFAPGSSARTLRGTASTGWYDSYAFAARAGQRLTLDAAGGTRNLNLILYGPGSGGKLIPMTLDEPITVPASGTYHLLVEVESDADRAYSVRLRIRG